MKKSKNERQELDEEQTLIAFQKLGLTIGFIVLVFAVFLSYKISQNFSEHTFVAILFGIPTNILLYFIVWKCFSIKDASLVGNIDDDGEEITDLEIHLPTYTGKQRFLEKLFNIFLVGLKVVSSLFFTGLIILVLFFSPEMSIYNQLSITCISIILLSWTHYRFLNSLHTKIVKKDNWLKKMLPLLFFIPLILLEFADFFN